MNNDYHQPSDLAEGASFASLIPQINPLMRTRERVYTEQATVFPDNPLPVSTRWAELLRYCPEYSRGSISAEWTPVYQYAERVFTGQRLMATMEHAIIRYFLYDWLHKETMIHTHVALLECANSEYWASRLKAKGEAIGSAPTRRAGTRIRKARTAPYLFTWLH